MRYLLSIILCLWASCSWAFPPGFIGAVTQGARASSEWDIEDDFSTNTAADYTRISASGTLLITGGVARTQNYNAAMSLQHNTDLGSDNQTVQAILCDGPSTFNATGVVIRSNGTSWHSCNLNQNQNRFDCTNNGGGTSSYIPFTAAAWSNGACHLVRITTNSSDLYSLFIDFNDDGDFSDTNEVAGTSTNSSYTGTKAGICFMYTAVSDDVYVDNFKAKSND